MEMLSLKVWGWYECLIEDQVQLHILAIVVLNRLVLLRRCNQLLWKVLNINFLNRVIRLALFLKCKALEPCSVSFMRYGRASDHDTVSSETLIPNSDRSWCLHTLWLPPPSRVLHGRQIGPCLVKKVLHFIGARNFITAFTKVRALFLSWAR